MLIGAKEVRVQRMKKTKRFGNNDFLATTAVSVLLFMIALGVGVYLRATAPEDDGSYLPGEQEITREIELLQEYVRIRTTPGNETEGAIFLQRVLRSHGIDSELIEPEPGRGSLYARIEGKRDGEGLLLLNHIDVIPATDEGWTRPPFAGEIHLNRLWGRGTLDMKGIGIAQLVSFIRVAESGVQPERTLVFLAVADEERGGDLGMAWLLENRPDIFEGIDYAINEGGVTEMLRDRIVFFGVDIGGKEFHQFRLVAGERKALEQLTEQWRAYRPRPEIEILLPEVEAYFQAIAPTRVAFRSLLEDVRAAAEEGRLDQLHPSYQILLQNNVAMSGIRESGNGGYEMTVVLWYLPRTDHERLKERILLDANDAGVAVFPVRSSVDREVSFSSYDSPFFDVLAEEVKREYGEEIIVGPLVQSKGVTDCRFLRVRQVDCYGIWPFPVSVYDSYGIHRVNERIRLDWFMQGVVLTERLVGRWVSDNERPRGAIR
jgi:acetylornithine deacetylase/succinyl-diaminopimelate desuccinylase-like protein